MKEQWKSLKNEGWGAYVLKEKLKSLKQKLKEWHRAYCGNLDKQILDAKKDLERWDLKTEEDQLNEKVDARRECMASHHRLSPMRCPALWQKARVRWLKDGEANTRFFHGYINKRRRKSEFLCLNFEGYRVEGDEQLKSAIMGHFQNHFQHRDWDRPVLDGAVFKQVGVDANAELAAPSQIEEYE